MTSPACSPISTRSPTSNGRRIIIKSQPAILTIGSFNAIVKPAETNPRKVEMEPTSLNQIDLSENYFLRKRSNNPQYQNDGQSQEYFGITPINQ